MNAPVDATKLPARERWSRALRALGRVLADPEQTDQVLVFSTYANAGTMPGRIHRFLDHPTGRRLYEEHRTIDARSIDLAALGELPAGTLGRAYAEFLSSRGFTPDVFEGTPDDIHDPAMAYVIQRMRQTHDLWHVVTGYDTDPASEVALQAFTYGQLGAPSSGILAVLGTLRGMSMRPTLARDVLRGYWLGRRAHKLAIFPWEDHWSTPLADVRSLLGLPVDTSATEQLGKDVRAVLAHLAAQDAVLTTNPSLTNAPETAMTTTLDTDPTQLSTEPSTQQSAAPSSDASPDAPTTTSPDAPTTTKPSLFGRILAARKERRKIRRAVRAVRRSQREEQRTARRTQLAERLAAQRTELAERLAAQRNELAERLTAKRTELAERLAARRAQRDERWNELGNQRGERRAERLSQRDERRAQRAEHRAQRAERRATRRADRVPAAA